MKIKNIYLLISLLFLFTSCYDKEDALKAELDEVPYKVEDSSDPLDHLVYQIYTNNRSIVRYKFSDLEYEWNMVRALMAGDSQVEVEFQEDKDILLKGLTYLQTEFFDFYKGKIKKEWMPFKVLLAKSISDVDELMGRIPKPVLGGLNHILVGNIDENIDKLTAEQKKKFNEELHGRFWTYYLYKYARITIPYDFFEVSSKYEDSLSTDDDGNALPNKDGYWYINDIYAAWGDYGPNRDMDVKQFFGKIVTTPYSELKPLLDANSKLKQKYDILVNHLKAYYNVDIQAIGDSAK